MRKRIKQPNVFVDSSTRWNNFKHNKELYECKVLDFVEVDGIKIPRTQITRAEFIQKGNVYQSLHTVVEDYYPNESPTMRRKLYYKVRNVLGAIISEIYGDKKSLVVQGLTV